MGRGIAQLATRGRGELGGLSRRLQALRPPYSAADSAHSVQMDAGTLYRIFAASFEPGGSRKPPLACSSLTHCRILCALRPECPHRSRTRTQKGNTNSSHPRLPSPRALTRPRSHPRSSSPFTVSSRPSSSSSRPPMLQTTLPAGRTPSSASPPPSTSRTASAPAGQNAPPPPLFRL